jgi:hypothetical protein
MLAGRYLGRFKADEKDSAGRERLTKTACNMIHDVKFPRHTVTPNPGVILE